jgi:hypothetical protein
MNPVSTTVETLSATRRMSIKIGDSRDWHPSQHEIEPSSPVAETSESVSRTCELSSSLSGRLGRGGLANSSCNVGIGFSQFCCGLSIFLAKHCIHHDVRVTPFYCGGRSCSVQIWGFGPLEIGKLISANLPQLQGLICIT